MSSGKLSYREKNSDGYKIAPSELFRVYPKIAKTDADEPSPNDWQSGQADGETTRYSAKFEIPVRRIKERVRLLKLLEDQTGTVKLLSGERSTLVAEVQRTF